MKRFINDVKKYYSYEVRSAKTTLKSEVANSYLNWIWWILDPLFSMMVYYVIFGIIFDSKEPHFTSFLFIGQTMWAFFSKNVTQSVKMIKRNKPIVSKVYIPKFVLLFTNMMVNSFKMAISWIIVIIMMILTGVEISPYAICFIPIMITLYLVTFAICINLMHFGVFIEDLGNVITIVMQLLFYMTGIFYSIESKLGEKYEEIAYFLTYANPMALLLQDMRKVLLYKQAPDWMALGIWSLVAILFAAIGIRTMYKNENSYVKGDLMSEEKEINMKDDIAIEVKNLSIGYKNIQSYSIKKSLLRLKKARVEEFQAVKNVSFTVPTGEILGIIGKNGSGKSTMLKALAGIFSPDEGTIDLKAIPYPCWRLVWVSKKR